MKPTFGSIYDRIIQTMRILIYVPEEQKYMTGEQPWTIGCTWYTDMHEQQTCVDCKHICNNDMILPH